MPLDLGDQNDEFVCLFSESVSLGELCDGTAQCSNGHDETSPLCESKTTV